MTDLTPSPVSKTEPIKPKSPNAIVLATAVRIDTTTEPFDMFRPVHGTDYLIDFYAVLGLTRDAGAEAISRAVQQKLAGVHPDTLGQRADPKVKSQADWLRAVYAKAADILGDSARKELYDIELAQFDPNRVSTDGMAIIDISARRLSVDYLVSGRPMLESPETARLLASSLKYSEQVLQMVEAQYQASPSPDKPLRDLYKDQLEQKLTALAVQESEAWSKAGVMNRPDPKNLVHPEDHLDHARKEVELTASQIGELVERRLLSGAGGGAPLLLPGAMAEAVQTGDLAVVRANATQFALDSFRNHEPELIRIAKERAEVMKKLLALTDWSYLTEGKAEKKLIVAVAKDDTILCSITFDCAWENAVGDPAAQDLFARVKVEHAPEIARSLQGTSVAVLCPNPEMDLMMQIAHVASLHCVRC